MWNKKKTQVLVSGAGPVGLMAAICLLKRKIEFEIVDKASGPCRHSQACLLSPETLEFLDQLDLAEKVLQKAVRIKYIHLYCDNHRLANLSLSDLPSKFPFIASIPQNELEDILLARLQHHHKRVLWNNRVTAVQREGDSVNLEVDRLGEHMTGYAVMHEEKTVDKTLHFNARLVLAADGLHSLIRRLQKIDYEAVGNRMGTLLFEVKRDPREDAALKLGFTRNGASVYVPLPHGLGRYGFTTDSEYEISADRDTGHELIEEDLEQFPKLTQAHFEELLEERMPYQLDKRRTIVWRASVPFGVKLADVFWTQGIFLLGDAARSGFPLGVKSLNLGLPEAAKVVHGLVPYLEKGDDGQLVKVAHEMKTEWEDLASLSYFASSYGSEESTFAVDPNLILQALPLTGKDLEFAADKLAKWMKVDSTRFIVS